ncbi:hypothetical protein CSQ89_19215 [Chitinimonas sp. BJB300]|nr:hypothetical protein CSQ89_19215 [Chitinimonas sp. BJB300]TSJ83903.1 GNAT family N-acetyltransferase [Chitinimonas sp. BJB300]
MPPKTLLYGDDERVMRWVCERIGITPFDDYRAIGLVHGNALIAGTVYERFSECDVNLHVAAASPYAMTRQFLVASFYYPFITAGKRRVTGLVPANNQRALAFDLKLGFKREGLIRRALPGGEDLLVLGMLREECRLIQG